MIACIRDEYGNTYFKKDLYLPEQIQKEAKKGRITFLVAEANYTETFSEIVGMLMLKEFYPDESMCEIASQIFQKKYRGYGLAEPFFIYALEIIKSRKYSAAYCLPVLFHNVTQRLLYRQGFRATGFVLNVFDMGRIAHSYQRDCSVKHSQGIQIMALEKKEAGTLYLPPEHKSFCKKIYDTLGTACHVADIPAESMESERKMTDMTWKQDEVQSSMEIHIRKIGRNLEDSLRKLHDRYPLTGRQTENIFLNINDRNAVWAYRKLTEHGYFFAGLKPLCSSREYMVLHHAGENEVFAGEYVLTKEFKKLAKAVWKNREEK